MSDKKSEQEPGQETSMLNGGGDALLGRVFGALTDQRRRYILYYLHDHEQAQVEDLAVHIVACEQDIPRDEVSSEVNQQVHTELVHSQLPKLDDYNLVEYDRRSGVVRYTHPPSLLEKTLKLAAALENPG